MNDELSRVCWKCGLTKPLGEEMNKMPEGRALDAWLAEKAGGFSCVHSYKGGEPRGYNPSGRHSCIPYYTTDPAAALGLLEEMRSKRWEWRISAYPVKGFCVDLNLFNQERGRWEGASINADTLPAAITTCVFRALGGDDA